MTDVQFDTLVSTLKARFEKFKFRHPEIVWDDLKAHLIKNKSKCKALFNMEETGGEPDVIAFMDGAYLFCDCSPESPTGRRSLCYDKAALDARKKDKPASSAQEMAHSMGVTILNEEEYRNLQKIADFDIKTSSWLNTPSEVRKNGGAIFGDRRYDRTFVYHNGADSYYAARGFRAYVLI